MRALGATIAGGLVLSGCSGGDDQAVDTDSTVVDTAGADSSADPTPVPVMSVDETLEAARVQAGLYLREQLPGTTVAVAMPAAYLLPGDTGVRFVASWASEPDDESSEAGSTTGQVKLARSSDGRFNATQAAADSVVERANLSDGGILVSVDNAPSQSSADASRDGVNPIVAALPLHGRTDLGWGSPDYLTGTVSEDDRWVLSRLPLEVGQELRDTGQIAAVETSLVYELLHVVGGVDTPARVLQAVPTDVLSPAWVAVGPDAVYSGRKAISSGLNPVLIRIDQQTGEIERLVAVLPDRTISNPLTAPPGWTVASPAQVELMQTVLHVDPDFGLIDEIMSMS